MSSNTNETSLSSIAIGFSCSALFTAATIGAVNLYAQKQGVHAEVGQYLGCIMTAKGAGFLATFSNGSDKSSKGEKEDIMGGFSVGEGMTFGGSLLALMAGPFH